MAGRTGFLGGWRGSGNPEWGDESRVEDSLDGFRFADPSSTDAYGRPAGFDPVWGTLGGPTAQPVDPWANAADPMPTEGAESEVEIFGAGFQISGKIRTGGFDRLSDWLNMQSGFIQVFNATHVILGRDETPEDDRRRGDLWIRVDQVVLVAERAVARQARAGAPVVQKQRRKVEIVTPGYHLRGSIHIIAAGSFKQFLETPDPHFMPITDLTVHWLDNPRLAARYPFAVINREQLITILDEPEAPAGESGKAGGDSAESKDAILQQWGAA